VRRLACVLALGAIAASARADVDAPVGAAAVGRAGAVLLDDDAGAVLRNPAALARRSSLRVDLGASFSGRSLTYATSEPFAKPAPDVTDASPVGVAPWGGAAVGLGEHVVVGAAVLAPTSFEFSDPYPTRAYDAMADDRQTAAGRYAGARLSLQRWAGGAAVAVRVLPWAALGASALAVHTEVESTRVLWAGSGGARLADLSPAFDVAWRPSADGWSPMAVAGLVAAPPDWPLELGASVAWRGSAHLEGASPAASSRGATPQNLALASLGGAAATLDLDAETVVRAGARVIASRFSIEVDGEVVLRGRATPVWRSDAVLSAGDGAVLGAVPLGPTLDDSFAVRAAVDVQLAPGFLSVSAGYAYASSPQQGGGATPVFPFGASHTLSAGVEARVDAARLRAGVAHDFRVAAENAPGDAHVIAPFDGGAVIPAAAGRLGGGSTIVALDLEIELP